MLFQNWLRKIKVDLLSSFIKEKNENSGERLKEMSSSRGKIRTPLTMSTYLYRRNLFLKKKKKKMIRLFCIED